jgi:signal transduction histidine kinase
MVHDLFEGDDPPINSFWGSLSIAFQMLILSLGYEAAVRRRWSPRKSLAIAVLISVICGWLTVVLHSPIDSSFNGLEKFWFAFAGIGILGFWFLVFYFPKQLDDARARTLAAESARAKAELARLRSNLHPHFLLNTLNAVAGLTAADPKQARQLLSALGDLLRDSLEDSDEMIPLKTEIDWLHRYAEIFEIRFEGKMRFEWAAAEASMDFLIPRLLLQPLIENAIEHGALRSADIGSVKIMSEFSDGSLRIVVQDNGPGMGQGREAGLGLRLVRERLLHSFPNATMSIDSSKEGCGVTLTIPNAARKR